MRVNPTTPLAAVLLAVLVVSVQAADVPVSYTVNDTALRAAVVGTPLTFTLYSDCSGTALGPVDPSLAKIGTVIGTTVYFTPSNGPTTTFNSDLERNGTYTSQALCDAAFSPGATTFIPPEGCCAVASNMTQMGPVGTEDLSPFVPPFHLE